MYQPYGNDPYHNNNEQPVDQERKNQTTGAYGSSPYTTQTSQGQTAQGTSYSPSTWGQAQGQQTRPSYTWNTQGAVPQQTISYYGAQPSPKKKKKSGGKLALKILAAVLCCAVVSFSSVGVFALMIQNGIVNVQSTGDSAKAAFTLYKKADNGNTPENVVVAGESMTPQEVAERLIPSVVCIQNYQISQQQQQGFFLGGYLEDNAQSGQPTPAGEGSGIVLTEDGYIVTNQHVIDGATTLKVITSDGMTYEAELVGEDTQTDLAVIKVNTEDKLTPANFGSSEDLRVADEVMAIGNPGGLQLSSSVTIGYVSALNRQVTNSETGFTVECIQTDAAINPGNSGGALVDRNGYVVGINSSKIVSTSYEGLGFAIPSDTVQPIVSDLIEYGYVKDRAMLGVTGMYVDRLTASFYGLAQGWCIEKATSANAQKAGLTLYDVITAIDEVQVTSTNTIASYIANKKPGETVMLTVVKASSGKTEQVELVLSENTGESD